MNDNHQIELKNQGLIILQHQTELKNVQNIVDQQKLHWEKEINKTKQNYSSVETRVLNLEQLLVEAQKR